VGVVHHRREVLHQQLVQVRVRRCASEVGDRLLDVNHLAIATTAGARGEKQPWWTKVRTVNESVLAVLAILNAIGAMYAFFE
jgi:hypothetical protein